MYERHRNDMVEKYVVAAGVTDAAVIAAMRKIPRHIFVETAMRHQAYLDKSLPIGFGQTISHPTTVALMTQSMALTGSEKVLEIGTGSGYQAAVLAEIGVKVYSIERLAELARRAQKIFDQLGYYSVGVRIGDGSVGWSKHAPYDRIIVTASSPGIPQSLQNQLADQGRMLIPVGDRAVQKLMSITRSGDKFDVAEADSRSFVPLIGKRGWQL